MKARWTTLFLLIVAAGAMLDGGMTYLLSPDLKLETNPVIAMGRGWTVLISIKVASTLLSTGLFYAALSILQSRPQDDLQSGKGLAPLRHALYGQEVSMLRFFFGMPRDKMAILAVTLLGASLGVIVGNLIAGTLNVVTLLLSRSVVGLGGSLVIVTTVALVIDVVLANAFLKACFQAEPGAAPNGGPRCQMAIRESRRARHR
jgi:hypothetical protein